MSDLPNTSKGKIGRLPAKTRETVNRHLDDGLPASKILAWLNGEPAVQEIMRAQFDGEPVNEQNLSNWRGGGFQKWLAEQKHIRRTQARAEYAAQLAKASGGNLAEGALAQLTGEIMEMVEEIADLREAGQEIDPKLLDAVNRSLVASRAKELETQSLALNQRKAEQKDAELALKEQEFELKYVAKFLEHASDKRAHDIATGSGTKEVKMDQLRELLFGKKPEAVAA